MSLTKGNQLHGFRIVTKALEAGSAHPVLSVRLSASDARCMKLASEHLAQVETLGVSAGDEGWVRSHLVLRSKNWPSLGLWDSSGVHLHSKAILAGFTLAGLVYGMIHLSAWDAPFPSVAQMWLWRASAITLMTPPLFLVIGLMGDYADDNDFCSLFCSPFSFAFMVIGVLCYVTARTYLVVECFIGLSHLPADAFMVLHWSRYFPYIA